MNIDRTNDARRFLLLQQSLYGDFSVGWNGIRTNSLGHRLVRGSLDGLTEISAEGLGDFPGYGLGLVFLEA